MRVLLIVLCLLATTTSAHAECAWMLWSQYNFGGNVMEPNPREGFSTKAECDKAYVLAFKSAKERGTPVIFSCLPDTVDPRGSKGK